MKMTSRTSFVDSLPSEKITFFSSLIHSFIQLSSSRSRTICRHLSRIGGTDDPKEHSLSLAHSRVAMEVMTCSSPFIDNQIVKIKSEIISIQASARGDRPVHRTAIGEHRQRPYFDSEKRNDVEKCCFYADMASGVKFHWTNRETWREMQWRREIIFDYHGFCKYWGSMDQTRLLHETTIRLMVSLCLWSVLLPLNEHLCLSSYEDVL